MNSNYTAVPPLQLELPAMTTQPPPEVMVPPIQATPILLLVMSTQLSATRRIPLVLRQALLGMHWTLSFAEIGAKKAACSNACKTATISSILLNTKAANLEPGLAAVRRVTSAAAPTKAVVTMVGAGQAALPVYL